MALDFKEQFLSNVITVHENVNANKTNQVQDLENKLVTDDKISSNAAKFASIVNSPITKEKVITTYLTCALLKII